MATDLETSPKPENPAPAQAATAALAATSGSYPTTAVGGKRASLIGSVVKALLSIGQIVVAALSGSAALMADALHNITDVFHSLATYLALRLAEKPADKGHPYGHGNAETLGALFVCGVMAAAGVFIITEAVERALAPEALVAPKLWGAAAALVAIVVNEALHRYYWRLGEKVGSPVLLAASADARQDSLASIVAVVGIVAASLALPWIDVLAAGVIGVFVMLMAAREAWNNLHILMVGTPGDPKLIERIVAVLKADPEVRDLHNVKVVQVGAWLHVALDMAVDGNLSVVEGHRIASRVTHRIREVDARIGDIQVHTDPWIDGAVHDDDDDRHFHQPSKHDVRFSAVSPGSEEAGEQQD